MAGGHLALATAVARSTIRGLQRERGTRMARVRGIVPCDLPPGLADIFLAVRGISEAHAALDAL
jgi:hypothetical protein